MNLKAYPVAIGPLVAQVIALRARHTALDAILKDSKHREEWLSLYSEFQILTHQIALLEKEINDFLR